MKLTTVQWRCWEWEGGLGSRTPGMLLPEMRAERPQRRALAVSASSVGGQRQPSPRHDANKCRGVNKHVTIHHDDERRGRGSPGSLQAR